MLAREGFGRLCIVDAASLCLFAHQLTSGVGVNIGFGQTFVVPVVDGRVIRDAVVSMRVGGMDLPQMMAQLFQVRGIRLRWTEEMQGEPIQEVTVARNLKERGCEVYPTTLRDTLGCAPYDLARVLGRDDAPYKEAALGGARFSLGWERYLPAELLSLFSQGKSTVTISPPFSPSFTTTFTFLPSLNGYSNSIPAVTPSGNLTFIVFGTTKG